MKTDQNDIMAALRAPFDEKDYEWRVQSEVANGTKVRVLCYVQARAIQNRLDEVVGAFGWQADYVTGPDGGVLCKLSILNRETGEWVMKADGASNTDIEPVKGGISGALKRAGSAWGIGRLLYDLDATVVPLQERGEHYHKTKGGAVKYWNTPKLPDWAVAGRTKKAAVHAEEDPQDGNGSSPTKKPANKPAVDLAKLKTDDGRAWLLKFSSAEAAIARLAQERSVSDSDAEYIRSLFEQKAGAA
jgi:hypothetical protein